MKNNLNKFGNFGNDPSKRYFKAIIFDMDGVISDTQKVHAEIELNILKKYGVQFDPEKHHAEFAGTSDEQMFEKMVKTHKLPVSVENLVAEKNKELFSRVDEIVEVPGFTNFLKQVSKEGYQIGLASGSSKKYIELVLEKLEIKKYFKAIVSAEEVKNGKPAPDVFVKAAELLQVKPRECIVFEDGLLGMIGAFSAGMKVIALVKDKATFKFPYRHVVIEKYSDLDGVDLQKRLVLPKFFVMVSALMAIFIICYYVTYFLLTTFIN